MPRVCALSCLVLFPSALFIVVDSIFPQIIGGGPVNQHDVWVWPSASSHGNCFHHN